MSKSTQLARSFNTQVGEGALTQYFLPTLDGNFRDMYRSGWLPSWFNQQWGGSQWGTLPDGSFGSVATGNVQDDATAPFGNLTAASNQTYAQRFILSEGMTIDSVWVKLLKNGDPTDNVQVGIYTVSGSDINTLVGSTVGISAKKLTSKTDGEWYQFTGLGAALTAGTTYSLYLNRSGTHNDTNKYSIKYTTSRKYPFFGMRTFASGAWIDSSTASLCFLIQNPAANSLIQSGGQFDHKLSFKLGDPVNQSRAVAQPLVNFYDGKNCTVLHRGTYSANTNIWSFTYGIDHDRIVCGVDASGYPYVRLFESDGTAVTVAHNASITTGFHDVGIKVRTYGTDTSDYLYLYVDGVSVGTPITGATFTMAPEMRQLGTARLGECFTHLPTWTQDMQMTALPSAQGWTGTASLVTEANAFSIQNNKLYQNKTGFDAADAGAFYYYSKTPTFSNATGWTVTFKVRVPNSPNNPVGSLGYGVAVMIQDGTKAVGLNICEYFMQVTNTSTGIDATVQGDFKSQDRVITVCGKGSDYWVFGEGRLLVDGTGKLITASALNTIKFGDIQSGSGENADAIWSYVKYKDGANAFLIPTAGANTCSEFAHWSGDKSALFPSLYNSGTPVSVKQLCGVPRNYQFEQVVQREVRRGVTSSGNTTTSTTNPPTAKIADLETYIIGSNLSTSSLGTQYYASGLAATFAGIALDGVLNSPDVFIANCAGAGQYVPLVPAKETSTSLGLHKVEAKWGTTAGTLTAEGTNRGITVEAQS